MGRVEWDIDDCASARYPRDGVRLFNTGAGRELLVLSWGVVAVERTEQSAIVLDVGVDGAREPVRIDAVRVRLIELLVARIVEQRRVRVGGSADDDVVHKGI